MTEAFPVGVLGHEGVRMGSVVGVFGLGGGEVTEFAEEAFGVEP